MTVDNSCFASRVAILCITGWLVVSSDSYSAEPLRFATFNVSFYGSSAGEVANRLRKAGDPQAAAVAEIIQRVRPDVLLLNEVDYDSDGHLVTLFQKNYLSIGQNASQSPTGPAAPVDYPYRFLAPTNSGVHSGHDLDHNGQIDPRPGSDRYAGDCWGYGRYPGQYGMALLSRYPLDVSRIRTFRKFRWQTMPGARLPDDPATAAPGDWYSPTILEHFPLSSKSHWDVPIQIRGRTIHVLACHPTPPTYDGPEDRNGRRNHDEIRFWIDYIAGDSDRCLYDDCGKAGGLSPEASFVIMGDLNGDPLDGEGKQGISALLASPRLSPQSPPASDGGQQQAKLQGGANTSHAGDPRYDTLDAADHPGPGNLRLDYVLPASNLQSVASGVFWPNNDNHLFSLVGTHPFSSSDHRLVWVDITWRSAE